MMDLILTPLRWLVLLGIAACGYFTIESNNMTTRAAAFVFSVVLWQLHGIIMVYDGYLLMRMSMMKKQAAAENYSMTHEELMKLVEKHLKLDNSLMLVLKEYVANQEIGKQIGGEGCESENK